MKQNIEMSHSDELESSETQYLTFRLAKELFAMKLSQTREVIEYDNVTQVPLMPAFLSGVINLRGEVVPIIDLALRLGKPGIQIQKRTCIIIVEVVHDGQQFTLGLLADAVCEFCHIQTDQIETAPSFGANIRSDFIAGIANLGKQFVVLLDADKTLSIKELAKLIETEYQ